MQFESLAEFLNMGGHGRYVWSAYGLTFAILAWNLLALRKARRQLLREEARRLRRGEET